jgi:glycosyltransferase involved in cell wall biosynthesis
VNNQSTNIGYIVVREDIKSPLIKSQVVDILDIVSKKKKVYLLWFYRIDYFFKKKIKKEKIKSDFLEKGIILIAIPILAGRFPVSWWQIPFILPQLIIGLLASIFFLKIKIFHARSYHAALASYCLWKLTKIPFVFDPRSPFPEENVAASRWKPNSMDYLFWKNIEKILCRNSKATLLTSQPFAQQFKQYTNMNNQIIIPNNYPKKFEQILNQNKNKNISSGIKICYVGSIGHWNDLNVYKNFFECLFDVMNYSLKIIFLVPERSVKTVYEMFLNSKIPEENFNVKFVEQDSILAEISDCTAGIYLMNRDDVRLGVKFVEYLASGLPVIVSSNIAGAAYFVKKNNVGFLLDNSPNYKEISIFLNNVNENRLEWNYRCKNIAMDEFSPESVANKLLKVYSSIESKNN